MFDNAQNLVEFAILTLLNIDKHVDFAKLNNNHRKCFGISIIPHGFIINIIVVNLFVFVYG